MGDEVYVDLGALNELEAELEIISNEMYGGIYFDAIEEIGDFYQSVVEIDIPPLLDYCCCKNLSSVVNFYEDVLCNEVKNLVGAIKEAIIKVEEGCTGATELFDVYTKEYEFGKNKYGPGFDYRYIIGRGILTKKELYYRELLKADFSRLDVSNILEDKYRVQGIFVKGDMMFVSAHYDEPSELVRNLVTSNKKKSRAYVYDTINNTCLGYIILDTSSHVGGIVYDYNNDIAMVSNGKGVRCYNMENLQKSISYNSTDRGEDFVLADLSQDELDSVVVNNDMDVSDIDKDCKNSTMYYDDGKVYVATFNTEGGASLIQYDVVKKDNSIKFENAKKYEGLDAYTQGIATCNYDDEQYVISCNSMAIGGTSLNAYKINGNNLECVGTKNIKYNGGESLFIDEENNIAIANELGNNFTEVNIKDVIGSEDSGRKSGRKFAGIIYDIFH